MRRTWLHTVIPALLVALTLSSCALEAPQPSPSQSGARESSSPSPQSEGYGISLAELSRALRDKYNDETPVSYLDPMLDLPPDHEFHYALEFDPLASGFDSGTLTQLVDVYADSELSRPAYPQVGYDPKSGTLTVGPPLHPVHGGDYLPQESDWGLAQEYYVAQYYDEHGNKLSKPKLTPFTIKRSLEAPRVEFFKQDGFMGLRWEPVEGATEYYVLQLRTHKETQSGTPEYNDSTLRKTSDTELVYEAVDTVDEAVSMLNLPLREESPGSYDIAVIAAREGDASPVSNLIASRDIAPILPCHFYIEESRAKSSLVSQTVDELELYNMVTMCDDSVVSMPVTYHTDQARVVDVSEFIEDFDEEFMALALPCSVKGTALTKMTYVIRYDYSGLGDDLKRLKRREDALTPQGGRLGPGIDLTERDDKSPAPSAPAAPLSDHGKVFATSALGEYLAINMLGGVETVDLSDFPESRNTRHLSDVLDEAYYQNPLILGVKSFWRDRSGNLLIEYDQSAAEQRRKQTEIIDEVNRVVSQIITPDMTELEKEIAINDYLCSTAEYDTDALENAEKYGYTQVDPQYDDSFTAYGVLINHKGVCASYAAAFKLLSDAAGLDSIIVTGYLNGGLPHAWNRARIGSDWMVLDVTNNDSEFLPNAVLNLPDSVARTILVESSEYMTDNKIGTYTGRRTDLEYYRVSELYYTRDQIADRLISELSQNGEALLRTDYSLTDRQVYELAERVSERGGFEELSFYNWIGVIYISLTP